MHTPGHEVYVTALHVAAAFDAVALRGAADAVLDRHAYLRSSFDTGTWRDPLQLVHRHCSAPVELVDLRHAAAPEQDGSSPTGCGWSAGVRSTSRRVRWCGSPCTGCTDTELQVAVSSFALDGWSTATVLTELLADYAARVRGSAAAFTPPRVGYESFIAREEQAVSSVEQRAFWERELDDAHPALVPTRTGTGFGHPLTQRITVPVGPEVSSELTRVARACGVSLKSVLLAAHLRVVRALTGQASVVTGLETNGRPEHARRRPGRRRVQQHPAGADVPLGWVLDRPSPRRRRGGAASPALPALPVRPAQPRPRRPEALQHTLRVHRLPRVRRPGGRPRIWRSWAATPRTGPTCR